MSPDVALAIAATCGAVALLAAVLASRSAWTSWRRVDETQQAATALLDVHRARLDEAIAEAAGRAGTLADGGEQLAESLAALRQDADELRWLVGKVPAERARLRRAVLDLLLPTDDDDAADEREGSRAR